MAFYTEYFHGQATLTPSQFRTWLPFLLCFTLTVEALQKIGNIYQPAQRNIPEDFYVQQNRYEKLISNYGTSLTPQGRFDSSE